MRAAIDSAQASRKVIPNRLVMNLKNQLTALLAHRGMTAAELSRKSGVSKQVLSLWTSGAKPKNVEQVKRVADALGVTVDHLLFGEGIAQDETRIGTLDALLGTEWIGGLFEIRIRRVRGGK